MTLIRNGPVDILRYLPDFLASDNKFKLLHDCESREHERMRLALNELFEQFFIPISGEKGIKKWEQLIGIIPKKNADIETRRRAVMLWLQSNQVSTVEFMTRLAARYFPAGSDVKIVEHNSEYCFDIETNNLPVDAYGLVDAIEMYKPAHLGYGLHSEIAIDSTIYIGAGLIHNKSYNIYQDMGCGGLIAGYVGIGSANTMAKHYEVIPVLSHKPILQCTMGIGAHSTTNKQIHIMPKHSGGAIHIEVAIGSAQQVHKNIRS